MIDLTSIIKRIDNESALGKDSVLTPVETQAIVGTMAALMKGTVMSEVLKTLVNVLVDNNLIQIRAFRVEKDGVVKYKVVVSAADDEFVNELDEDIFDLCFKQKVHPQA